MNVIAILNHMGVYFKEEPIRELHRALERLNFQIVYPNDRDDLLKLIENNARLCGVIFDWDKYNLELCEEISKMNENLPLYAFANTYSTLDVSLNDLRLQISFFEYALGAAEDIANKIKQTTDEYINTILPPLTKALFKYVREGKYTFCTPGHMGGTAFQKSPVGSLFYDFFGPNTMKSDISISVSELGSLLDDIKKENISQDIVRPYTEQVENRIRAMDEKKIKEICGDVGRMDFEDASEAAKQLEDGDFLPQLKFDALKELEQRMSKIKTEECGLLVSKLLNAFDEAGVTESKRCHFYPAKRVWQRLAEPEETAVFEGAVEHFANGIGKFEYPVLLVDRSKDESGKEGVLLTPEKLYYSAWMTSYYIPVMDIESIQAVTGLLNRGIYVYQKNGSKTKLPLAVEHEEMEKFAKVLEDFVRYLQEKPFSRKESYLAKEKHDTICCYRCGYIYKGVGVCPRCGYKQNE